MFLNLKKINRLKTSAKAAVRTEMMLIMSCTVSMRKNSTRKAGYFQGKKTSDLWFAAGIDEPLETFQILDYDAVIIQFDTALLDKMVEHPPAVGDGDGRPMSNVVHTRLDNNTTAIANMATSSNGSRLLILIVGFVSDCCFVSKSCIDLRPRAVKRSPGPVTIRRTGDQSLF